MEVKNRYFGSSQKALLVALKDAQKNIISLLLCLLIDKKSSRKNHSYGWIFISHYRPTLKVNENKVER